MHLSNFKREFVTVISLVVIDFLASMFTVETVATISVSLHFDRIDTLTRTFSLESIRTWYHLAHIPVIWSPRSIFTSDGTKRIVESLKISLGKIALQMIISNKRCPKPARSKKNIYIYIIYM